MKDRLKYGEEPDGDTWGNGITCPDCGVSKNEYHIEGCDIEKCPDCSGQYISCGCDD